MNKSFLWVGVLSLGFSIPASATFFSYLKEMFKITVVHAAVDAVSPRISTTITSAGTFLKHAGYSQVRPVLCATAWAAITALLGGDVFKAGAHGWATSTVGSILFSLHRIRSTCVRPGDEVIERPVHEQEKGFIGFLKNAFYWPDYAIRESERSAVAVKLFGALCSLGLLVVISDASVFSTADIPSLL